MARIRANNASGGGGGADLSTKPRLACFVFSSYGVGKCRYNDGTTQGAEITITSASTTILDNDYVTVGRVGAYYSQQDYIYFKKPGWLINHYDLYGDASGNSTTAVNNFTSTYPQHFNAGEYIRDTVSQYGLFYNQYYEIMFE